MYIRWLVHGDQSFSFVYALPEFIQLMDNDIVSLVGLILIVNPLCRENGSDFIITQLPLSLYLMTQFEMKLHLSVTSLAQTLDYIEVALRTCEPDTLDRLLLKLTVLDRDVDTSGCARCHQAGLRSARLRSPTPSSRLEY